MYDEDYDDSYDDGYDSYDDGYANSENSESSESSENSESYDSYANSENSEISEISENSDSYSPDDHHDLRRHRHRDAAILAAAAAAAATTSPPSADRSVKVRSNDRLINQWNGQIKQDRATIEGFESKLLKEKDPNVIRKYQNRIDACRRRIDRMTAQIEEREKLLRHDTPEKLTVLQILAMVGIIIFSIAVLLLAI